MNNSMNTTKIAFIGAGNMAAALVEGLISKGLNAEQVIMSDPSKDRLAYVEKTFGVKTSSNNRTAADQADVIMLAVKPQIMSAILDDLKPAVADRSKVIISIAAGITLARLAKSLGNETALVRCMPNTPALVQTGATGMFANEHVSSAQKALAEQILQAVGIVVWLEQEQQLDAVTALSGSGPAYYFLVMEAMIAAGEAMGLTPDTAKQLTLQTALGAAKMAGTGDVDPAELRRRVTSPGGTTEAAIHSLEKNQLVGIFGQALAAAKRRSEELGQQG